MTIMMNYGLGSSGPPALDLTTSVTRLGNYFTLGNFSKPVATIILPKVLTSIRQCL